MDKNNLKRRRPYSHGEGHSEPVLQSPSQPFSPARDTPILSPQQRHILEQAASILNVSLHQLLDVHTASHPTNKRPRLSTDISMAPLFAGNPGIVDARHEKSPISGVSTRREHDSRRPFNEPLHETNHPFLSLSGASAQIAQCLASFSACQPCSIFDQDSGYQAVAAPVSYAYTSSTMAVVDVPALAQDHPHTIYAAASHQPGQAGLYAYDDPHQVSPCLPEYPSLQPGPPAAVQPSTTREGMVYPAGTASTPYLKSERVDGHLSTPDITTVPHVADYAAYAGNALAASPDVVRHPDIVSVQHGYGMLETSVISNSMSSDGQASQTTASDMGMRFVASNSAPPPSKRGPFKNPAVRQQTAHTRKIGSCIRCRMQRIRCEVDPEDEKSPCLGCKKVFNAKVWRLPCLRWKITDVRLFKPGQVRGYEWTTRWKDSIVVDDIGTWASAEVKTIYVTEGCTNRYVGLQVRRFVPQKGDKTVRTWVDKGQKRSVEIPPYAIIDLEKAKDAYDRHIKEGLIECCKQILGPREKLLWNTYFMAITVMRDASTHPEEAALLRSTLELWMSIRLTTRSFQIIGDEKLGMSLDETSQLRDLGSIPLPPVMGAQIDSILIHQTQAKLRRDTLETLQKMTQGNKQQTWLTTYLVTFILLHNIALITRHDASYARKHDMKRRFAREDTVREYHMGANILLAYFHYCNKGIYPFSAECKDSDLRNLAQLEERALQLVRHTRTHAAGHKMVWEDLWETNAYENDYYFIGQLFEQNWHPRPMII